VDLSSSLQRTTQGLVINCLFISRVSLGEILVIVSYCYESCSLTLAHTHECTHSSTHKHTNMHASTHKNTQRPTYTQQHRLIETFFWSSTYNLESPFQDSILWITLLISSVSIMQIGWTDLSFLKIIYNLTC